MVTQHRITNPTLLGKFPFLPPSQSCLVWIQITLQNDLVFFDFLNLSALTCCLLKLDIMKMVGKPLTRVLWQTFWKRTRHTFIQTYHVGFLLWLLSHSWMLTNNKLVQTVLTFFSVCVVFVVKAANLLAAFYSRHFNFSVGKPLIPITLIMTLSSFKCPSMTAWQCPSMHSTRTLKLNGVQPSMWLFTPMLFLLWHVKMSSKGLCFLVNVCLFLFLNSHAV